MIPSLGDAGSRLSSYMCPGGRRMRFSAVISLVTVAAAAFVLVPACGDNGSASIFNGPPDGGGNTDATMMGSMMGPMQMLGGGDGGTQEGSLADRVRAQDMRPGGLQLWDELRRLRPHHRLRHVRYTRPRRAEAAAASAYAARPWWSPTPAWRAPPRHACSSASTAAITPMAAAAPSAAARARPPSSAAAAASACAGTMGMGGDASGVRPQDVHAARLQLRPRGRRLRATCSRAARACRPNTLRRRRPWPLRQPAIQADGGTVCTPKTCSQLGINCGPAGDGCGNMLACGTCQLPGAHLRRWRDAERLRQHDAVHGPPAWNQVTCDGGRPRP